MTSNMVHHGVSAFHATQNAVESLYGSMQQQASILAYIDVFWLMSIGALLMLPLVFLLRKAKRGQAPVAGH